MSKEAGDAVTCPLNAKPKANSPEPDGADEKMLQDEEVPLKIEIMASNEKQNGDAKLDIEGLKTDYVGMGKEELLKYANDPFWVRLRWFLFIAFWVLWAAMLIGAIVIIYAAPKCDPPPPKTWWEQGPLAEVELDVTTDELKQLKEKQIKGIIVEWPEDAYLLPSENHSFVSLLKNAKDHGINVIVGLEPGTSQMFFNYSVIKDEKYKDYYIWKPSKIDKNDQPTVPNNWLNASSLSSWLYSTDRSEYYYAPHGKPLLDFRNQLVIDEFSKVIGRFIGFGANGVRLRDVPHLLVDNSFDDEEPKPNNPGILHTSYDFYIHSKTEHVKDLGLLLQQWRQIVKNKTETGVFMVADKLSKITSYKVNSTLTVDLPLEADVFTRPAIDVLNITRQMKRIFEVDSITWPLWKHNSTALPTDVLDIITFLLPGTVLIDKNATVDPALLKLRDSPSVMRGILNFTTIANNSGFAYIRVTSGNPGILVAVNPTDKKIDVNFVEENKEKLDISEEITIQYFSKNYNETNFNMNVKKSAKHIPLSPKSAIVLSYVPKKKDG